MKKKLFFVFSLGVFFGLIFLSLVGLCQEPGYKVKLIYTPPIIRPDIKVNLELLPRGTKGSFPAYDGQPFHLNLVPHPVKEMTSDETRSLLNSVLKAIHWDRPPEELRLVESIKSPLADAEYIEKQIKSGEEETLVSLKKRFGKINQATEKEVKEQSAFLREQSREDKTIFIFNQFFKDVPFDETGLLVTGNPQKGFESITGRVFNTIIIKNSPKLSPSEARLSAEEYIGQFIKATGKEESKPILVILPYEEAFLYAWKMDIQTSEGPYQAWIDAMDGQVLQLLPLFDYDQARGLVFNPDPDAGTRELSFEVDPPEKIQLMPGPIYKYYLRLNGVLDVNNAGADGVCIGDLTIPGGSGVANFNVSPINGTVVERTSDTGYNCRFQDVNAYGWFYNNRETYLALGSQPFSSTIIVTVNDNNPCWLGPDNACASGYNFAFGIGTATTGTSTACNDHYNTALDATVISHEFGHRLNRNQLAVGGGTVHGSVNEGLADFWGCAFHNTDTHGGWSSLNCTSPVQTGFSPRQAEATDIFPEHRYLFAPNLSQEIHADGQMMCWALWDSRRELLDLSMLGNLSIMLNIIDALETSGVGISPSITDRGVHDAFLNILQNLSTNYQNSRQVHKILAGFARAGIFLSERDAIIDIDDDYLRRGESTGPTFTIWTGRDYVFNANGTANTTAMPYNTQFSIDIASDEAFNNVLVSSGQLGGVVSGAGGTATWTMPAPDWNNIKSRDEFFYRVITTDNAGGNSRSSLSPGDGFFSNVPPPRAVINESGACCLLGSTSSIPGIVFITLSPFFAALLWRRRINKRNHLDYAHRDC